MSEFLELSDENFTTELALVDVALVDYYASWCGACRMAAPMFKRVAAELNLPIYKVDAEKNPAARAQVEIANLPTVAVFKKGVAVGFLCTTKEDSLKEFINSHLK